MGDRWLHGRDPRAGVRNPKAKLSEEDVRKIRRMLAQGESVKTLALEFRVSEKAVRRIKNGTGWTHLE